MEYKGYELKHMDGGHILVTSPEGETWTEDSERDAKISIEWELQYLQGGDGTNGDWLQDIQ